MPNVMQNIPGVIWYIILEYLGINVLARKKCCLLTQSKRVCKNKREFDEIWCRTHSKYFTMRLENENVYNLAHEMIGGERIERSTRDIFLCHIEYKRYLLYRYKIRKARKINVQGFNIPIMNGIYEPVNIDFVMKHDILTNTIVYVKKFGPNLDEGMHLFLWKFNLDNTWYITSKYLLGPRHPKYNILRNTCYAHCKNNANYPHQIQMYSALNTANIEIMPTFTVSVVSLETPNSISFDPIYLPSTYAWNVVNTIISQVVD